MKTRLFSLLSLLVIVGCSDARSDGNRITDPVDAGADITADRTAVSCPAPMARCGSECFNLQSDALHCGACSHACAAGEGCVGGACVSGCPSPRAICGAQCVDLQSDPNNCAACTHACSGGQTCLDGRCVLTCAPGQAVCDGRCIDPQIDSNNCGACGLVCASGQSCASGLCVSVGVPDAGRDVPIDLPIADTGGGGGCLPVSLGSAIGSGIASGDTTGRASVHTPPATCTDMPTAVSPDAVYAWTAPFAGPFTFDTMGSGFDTVLTVRSGSCTGTALACNDDIGGGVQASQVSVTLGAGQTVILAVEGYGASQGTFVLNVSAGGITDAGGPPDVGVTDPCSGVSVDGRCASATQVEYCNIPTEGTGRPTLERVSCGAGERCALSIDGIATCQLVVACREGDEQCLGATQLRRCVGGAWLTQTCARECIGSPIGDFCTPNTSVRTVTGRVIYVARGPNSTTRPTDWTTSTFTASAQSFLVVSTRQNPDGTTSFFDATTTSIGNVDGGRFSIRVPVTTTSTDHISVIAAAGDGAGGLRYLVANPTFPSAGEQSTIATPPRPTIWTWVWTTNSFVSGDTLTITEAMGSGAARIYDYLRYAYQFAHDQFARDGLPLVAWFQYGTSWTCGKCMARRPTSLFGSATAPGLRFDVQGFFDGSASQAYWADAVTAHELGHWVMSSYSAPPTEGGRHVFGGHVYPGMAWSEGFATWFSSDVRSSSLYYDKQGSTFYWFDIAARAYAPGIATLPWERPMRALGLEQLIDENEVASILWTLRGGGASSPAMYRALASARMQGPTFARGYRAWRWDTLSAAGDPIGATHTTTPTPHLADFLDALACNGFSRASLDAATQPSLYYPYPSASPLCF